MDDRMVDAPAQVQNEPLTPKQTLNATLRWLGILLPLVMVYGLGLWLGFGRGSYSGFRTPVMLGAALWVGFAVTLAWRRDWRGAAAISACYVLVDAWWWLLALGVIHTD